LTGFFDPSVQFGLKFEFAGVEPADNDEDPEDAEAGDAKPPRPAETEPEAPAADEAGAQVVSLDAFRKKT
jgi:hypothetical protein